MDRVLGYFGPTSALGYLSAIEKGAVTYADKAFWGDFYKCLTRCLAEKKSFVVSTNGLDKQAQAQADCYASRQ